MRQKSNGIDPLVIAANLDFKNDVLIKSKIPNLQVESHLKYLNIKEKYYAQWVVSSSKKQVSCKKCDKEYADSRKLWRHVETLHEGTRYPCDQCNTTPFTD